LRCGARRLGVRERRAGGADVDSERRPRRFPSSTLEVGPAFRRRPESSTPSANDTDVEQRFNSLGRDQEPGRDRDQQEADEEVKNSVLSLRQGRWARRRVAAWRPAWGGACLGERRAQSIRNVPRTRPRPRGRDCVEMDTHGLTIGTAVANTAGRRAGGAAEAPPPWPAAAGRGERAAPAGQARGPCPPATRPWWSSLVRDGQR